MSPTSAKGHSVASSLILDQHWVTNSCDVINNVLHTGFSVSTVKLSTYRWSLCTANIQRQEQDEEHIFMWKETLKEKEHLQCTMNVELNSQISSLALPLSLDHFCSHFLLICVTL